MAKKKNSYVVKNGYTYLMEYVKYEDGGKNRYKEILSKVSGVGKATKLNQLEIQQKTEKFLHELELKKVAVVKKQEKSTTCTALFHHWLAMYKRKLSGNTRTTYINQWNQSVNDTIGNTQISEITSTDIFEIFETISHKAGTTQKHIYSLLSGFFDYYHKDGKILRNPMISVPTPEVEYKETVAPSTVDLYKVVDMIQESRMLKQYKLGVLIAAEEALRISEIAGITIQNIDFEEGVLFVHRKVVEYAVSGTHDKTVEASDKMKSKLSKRTITLTETTLKAIKQYIADNELKPNPDEYWLTYLLQDDDGNFISPKKLGDSYNKFLNYHMKRERINKEMRKGIHATRAHQTTLLRSAGYNEEEIASQLGHSVKISKENYTEKSKKRTAIKDVYSTAKQKAINEAKEKDGEIVVPKF